MGAALRQLRSAGGYFKLREGTPQQQDWFDFINTKAHILDVLEHRSGMSELWKPAKSLLDVGAGHGFLDAYLMAKHGTEIVAIDVSSSYQCDEIFASPLLIHFFNGKDLVLRGQPIRPRSFDAVSFISVLHHAASNSAPLLEQAATIARRWIMIFEDLQTGDPAIAKRNYQHDPTGIFRSSHEWKELFRANCPDFCVVRQGYMGKRLYQHDPVTDRSKPPLPGTREAVVVGVQGREKRMFQRWFVLERRRAPSAKQSLWNTECQTNASKEIVVGAPHKYAHGRLR